MRPRARRSNLVIRDLPGEVVVYDRDRHQAHCLNRTAALVFQNANGRRTVSELASLVAAECGHETSEQIVRLTLETLAEAGLLESPVPSAAAATSRREALRRVGLGAAALVPVVTSLLVPTPAEAAATCIQQSGCTGPTGEHCWEFDVSECELTPKTCTGPATCQ